MVGMEQGFRPLMHTGPKQLIPIANKPISQYTLEDLKNSGIKDIAIVLGDIHPEKVIEYYGDGAKFNVKIKYINQGKPKGIAHAIVYAKILLKKKSLLFILEITCLKVE